MPGGIQCRVGYHAGWDTMPGGIPEACAIASMSILFGISRPSSTQFSPCKLQHSATQHKTYNTVQCIQHSAIYTTVQCIQHSAIYTTQCDTQQSAIYTTQCNIQSTAAFNTMQHTIHDGHHHCHHRHQVGCYVNPGRSSALRPLATFTAARP